MYVVKGEYVSGLGSICCTCAGAAGGLPKSREVNAMATSFQKVIMFSTVTEVRLKSLDESPLSARKALTELSVVLNRLPWNTYEETKTFGSYDCTHDQIHYWKQEDLTDLEAKAMPEMNRFGVFALDMARDEGFLPEILSVQPHGGRQRITCNGSWMQSNLSISSSWIMATSRRR